MIFGMSNVDSFMIILLISIVVIVSIQLTNKSACQKGQTCAEVEADAGKKPSLMMGMGSSASGGSASSSAPAPEPGPS